MQVTSSAPHFEAVRYLFRAGYDCLQIACLRCEFLSTGSILFQAGGGYFRATKKTEVRHCRQFRQAFVNGQPTTAINSAFVDYRGVVGNELVLCVRSHRLDPDRGRWIHSIDDVKHRVFMLDPAPALFEITFSVISLLSTFTRVKS